MCHYIKKFIKKKWKNTSVLTSLNNVAVYEVVVKTEQNNCDIFDWRRKGVIHVQQWVARFVVLGPVFMHLLICAGEI